MSEFRRGPSQVAFSSVQSVLAGEGQRIVLTGLRRPVASRKKLVRAAGSEQGLLLLLPFSSRKKQRRQKDEARCRIRTDGHRHSLLCY